jgi:acyl-CoA thioesterase-1
MVWRAFRIPNLVIAAAFVSTLLAHPTLAATPVRILVLGDSLSSGWGLPADQAFPARLEAAMRARGLAVRLINAGVAGDTTAGGKARLDWALSERPEIVIVELGANDGMRGVDPRATRANLDDILTRLKTRGVRILLAGMIAPPNLGEEFGREFNAVFPELARRHGVAYYPFFLAGVAARRGLNQPDGIHPNARGVAVIVDRILPYVVRLLKSSE